MSVAGRELAAPRTAARARLAGRGATPSVDPCASGPAPPEDAHGLSL